MATALTIMALTGVILALLRTVGDVVDSSLASESPLHIIEANLGLFIGSVGGAIVHAIGLSQPWGGDRLQRVVKLASDEPEG
jgi:hypothetical protein